MPESSAMPLTLHRLCFMKVSVLVAAASANLLLVNGLAWSMPDQGSMRMYNQRMESLFLRLDSDGNGRLEHQELNGRPALQRQLKRNTGRDFLLLEDIRTQKGTVRGQRLTRRFRGADRNSDRRLNRREAARLPWIERHFDGLDRNRDGHVTLGELWDLQRSLAPRQRRP